jgi:hypothetical protein
LLTALALTSGCGILLPAERYHLAYGPASMVVQGPPGTASLSINLEEGAVFWAGPEKPSAEELGYITENGEEEAPTPPGDASDESTPSEPPQ